MTSNKSKATSTNQSSEKLLTIMEYLSTRSEPSRLFDIAEATGINTSTVSRFLSALINRGYADQDTVSGKYYLTFKICKLAFNVSQSSNVRQVAQPYLNRLAASTLCTANLVVEYNMSIIYLEVIMPSRQLIEPLKRIGGVAPMHCTGAGKILLSNHDNNFIESLFRQKGFQRFTENTITGIDKLRSELETIRINKFAYDNEECEYGTRCFAVPIYNYSGRVIAALSINGSVQKLTDDFIASKKQLVMDAAAEISRRLGYDEKSF